jgi:hypothetical protein
VRPAATSPPEICVTTLDDTVVVGVKVVVTDVDEISATDVAAAVLVAPTSLSSSFPPHATTTIATQTALATATRIGFPRGSTKR